VRDVEDLRHRRVAWETKPERGGQGDQLQQRDRRKPDEQRQGRAGADRRAVAEQAGDGQAQQRQARQFDGRQAEGVGLAGAPEQACDDNQEQVGAEQRGFGRFAGEADPIQTCESPVPSLAANLWERRASGERTPADPKAKDILE
jgi:hypothetical protein